MLGDNISTYSMRNLGGKGVVAATFITWDDVDDDGDIDLGEELMAMDIVHNSTVKWGTDTFQPKGRWFDVQGVGAHEVGHAFGMDHTGNFHEEDFVQTMFALVSSKDTSLWTLEFDGDVLGIRFLYGP